MMMGSCFTFLMMGSRCTFLMMGSRCTFLMMGSCCTWHIISVNYDQLVMISWSYDQDQLQLLRLWVGYQLVPPRGTTWYLNMVESFSCYIKLISCKPLRHESNALYICTMMDQLDLYRDQTNFKKIWIQRLPYPSQHPDEARLTVVVAGLTSSLVRHSDPIKE